MKYTGNVIKLNVTSKKVLNIELYHLILSDISEVNDLIDKEIKNIWQPKSSYSLGEVKKEIHRLMSSKNDLQKHGICAEFFMHLFLRELGYKQKCVFSNLEENSMKKGFDGVYENLNDFWIAESKCGITEVKHKDKIKEALDDIDDKIFDTSKNNPWKNAFHHILIQNNKKKDPLLKRVDALSKDYLNGVLHDSSEFNLIPTSTLFVNNNQSDQEIKNEIKKIISNRKIKNMIVLCINNDIYKEFIAYLEGS